MTKQNTQGAYSFRAGPANPSNPPSEKDSIHIYLDPAKDVFFSGEGNFQAKLKKPTQQTVLVSIFVTSALFFVTSASFWRHVFYREFAACFCVMFSGETEKKTSFQGPGI